MNDEPKEDDSEARSVFVSQLAARLTARDLGYFFEDKLGEGTVLDARIVTDRLSRRSKGYVCASYDLAVIVPDSHATILPALAMSSFEPLTWWRKPSLLVAL